MVSELYFDVSQEDGWLVAICKHPEMATQAKTVEDLVRMVRELIECHFDEGDPLRKARPTLRFFRDAEAMAYA